MTASVQHLVTDVQITWMVRRDMPAVLAIERDCFEFPWDEDAFIRCLRQRNCIGHVAEHKERIVGFMIYELHKYKLRILNFAVHPDFRRQTIGAQIIKKLIGKMAHDRRNSIYVKVRESNLDAQLFLKAMGFRCVNTLRDWYEETDEDAYEFMYRIK